MKNDFFFSSYREKLRLEATLWRNFDKKKFSKIFLTKIFFSTTKYEIIVFFIGGTTKKSIYNEKKNSFKKIAKCAFNVDSFTTKCKIPPPMVNWLPQQQLLQDCDVYMLIVVVIYAKSHSLLYFILFSFLFRGNVY